MLVTTSWIPGGLTTWTHEFASQLSDRGHDVTCACVKVDWLLHREMPPFRNVRYKMAWLRASPLNYLVTIPRFLSSQAHPRPFDSVVSTEAEGTRIPRGYNGQAVPHVAVVHVPEPEYIGAADLFRATLATGKNLLLSRFGGSQRDVTTQGVMPYWRWVQYLGRKRVGRASVAVCVSRFQMDAIRSRWKIPQEKIRMIYNGIDTDAFHPSSNGRGEQEKRLLFVGGSNPRKGIDLVIEAFAHVHRRHPQVSLDLLGGWDWRAQRETAARLGIGNQIRFHPYLPHEDMPAHYRRAYAFLAPTRAESFGIALAEAMACGVPVISTRTGAVPELIDDGVNGILVPVNDPLALAEAALELLDDPQKAEEMGRAGRRRVEQDFAWDVIMPSWEELLERLAGGGDSSESRQPVSAPLAGGGLL